MLTPRPGNDENIEPARYKVPGRPPRISREQIVAAARLIPRGELTMGAVADALGVSRKALHYYVGDREGLINLVVAELYESQLAAVSLPGDADWQTVLRAWARAIREGVAKVGVAPTYVQLRGPSGTASMDLAEHVTQSLLDAGFDNVLARRALSAISNIAFAAANFALLEQQHGTYPHESELGAALAQASEGDFPALRQVLATVQSEDSGGFEFELNLMVTALELALAESLKER
jgi:TetR/AcrR family tetracycline transcriptional repressor